MNGMNKSMEQEQNRAQTTCIQNHDKCYEMSNKCNNAKYSNSAKLSYNN